MAGGAMIPGAAAAPPGVAAGGQDTFSKWSNPVYIYPWMAARGYGGLISPVAGAVQGTPGWFSRQTFKGGFPGATKAKQWSMRRGPMSGVQNIHDFFDWGGRNQRMKMSWFTAATERALISHGATAPWWLMGGAQQRLGGFKSMEELLKSNKFVYKGVFEHSLLQMNLLAQGAGKKSPYTNQQLTSIYTRMNRIARARGINTGAWAKEAGMTFEEALGSMKGGKGIQGAKFLSQNVMTSLLPGKLSTILGKMATGPYSRYALGGANLLGKALPVASFYFTAKLVSDITSAATKRIVRGINWWYFKMPLTVYQYGTQGLRQPILGSTYMDTPGAQTSRQRAVQAIQNSRLNARSALSSEAQMMHQYFG